MSHGILIVAHAPLASALRACAAHVYAERMDSVHALDVSDSDTQDQALAKALTLRQTMGSAPVLVLADMLGATPCNVATRLVQGTSDVLLAGVNLPMLWRAMSYQNEAFSEMTDRAQEGALRGVTKLAE
jgi:PTS system ascorbate-specific IIA component